MDRQIEIRLLQGVDKEFSKTIGGALSYMTSRVGIPAMISVVDTISFEPDFQGRFIVYLDALNLEKLSQDQGSINALLKFQEIPGKVILILEDIMLSQIPDYLSKAHSYFHLSSTISSEAVEENIGKNNKASLITILHDVVHYLKASLSEKTLPFTLYFGTPDIEVYDTCQGIMRETIHRGYSFLPKALNPTGKQQITEKGLLWDDLKKCQLSIHFISHHALGQYPEKLSPSLEVNRLIAEYCHQSGSEHLHRIIYIPPEDDSTSEQVLRKIAMFKNDSYNLKNAELVQIPVEKLKNIIQAKHYEWYHPKEKKVESHSEDRAVYFIFPPGQEQNLESYFSWFDQNNILFNKSQIGLDQLDLLRYHQEMLKQCNGVVIYHDGNEEWLSRKISDLKKSPGWGRIAPFKFKVICGEPIEKQFKELQEEQNLTMLTGQLDFNQLKKAIIV